MDFAVVADELSEQLKALGRPERAEHERAYLKSELEHLGCSVPVIRKTVKAFLAPHSVDRAFVLEVVGALWEVPIHERRFAAVEILVAHIDLLERQDLDVIETYVRQCRGWALLDGLAAGVGPWLDRFDDATDVLDRWATDPDFWVRRAALLAHLLPLRSGTGDFDRFGRYADSMLEEKEFFIRKAIGWVLRDTSRKRPYPVAEWALPRAHRMSGVTVREVVKYLDDETAAEILRLQRER